MPRRFSLSLSALAAALCLVAHAAPAQAEKILLLKTNAPALKSKIDLDLDERIDLGAGQFVELLKPDLTTGTIRGVKRGRVRDLLGGRPRFDRAYKAVERAVRGDVSASRSRAAARGELVTIGGWPYRLGALKTQVFCSAGERPLLKLPTTDKASVRAAIAALDGAARAPIAGMSTIDAREGLRWPEAPKPRAQYKIITSEGALILVVKRVKAAELKRGPKAFARLVRLGCKRQALAVLEN